MKRLRASFDERFGGLFRKEEHERECANETQLQRHIEDNLRFEMTPVEARRQAILRLGGIESTQQACREGMTIAFLESLLQDLRFALRQLGRRLGFTATTILILALSICSSVSIFSFVDAALIKPLPYQNPGRLVGLFESKILGSRYHLSYPDYLEWKSRNKVFSSLDVYQDNRLWLSTPLRPEETRGIRVSAGFFRTLGVTPVLGRDFRDGEDAPSSPRTVMLSYSAWQTRYGARHNVLGETITIDGAPNIIIGVLPRDFHFAPVGPADFWTTLHDADFCRESRHCHLLYGIARLKDGISIQTAQTDLMELAQQLTRQFPEANHGRRPTVFSLTNLIFGNVRSILLVLMSGAALLLLIACVNVTSLLLVRSESRKREISIRRALGVPRTRLIRQFVTEGLVLAAAGSTLGIILAHEAIELLVRLIPTDMMAGMPYLHELGLSVRVLGFACSISLLASIQFSLVPIAYVLISDTQSGLKEGAGASAGTVWRRLGPNLVVVELAVATVLLICAGLLGKSFYRLLHVDAGLEADHLATLRVGIPSSKNESSVALEHRILSRIASLPGVDSVSVSDRVPLDIGDDSIGFRVIGRPYHGEDNEANSRVVSAAYFTTLHARLLRGRYFTDRDDESRPMVGIINQTMANQYFPGENPLGRKIIPGNPISPQPPLEIVGVVADMKEGPLDVATRPAIYVPFNQNSTSAFSLVVRTSQNEQWLIPTLTATIHQISSGIGISGETTVNEIIEDSPSAYLHRSAAWLVGAFAAMALLLSVIGLYGVVAYSVIQRTREIGVRMALGAQRSSVSRLILKEAGLLTVGGTTCGLVFSAPAGMLMAKLLFGVHFWDVPTLATVAGVLAISAMLACYIPAQRAASINPIEALRAE